MYTISTSEQKMYQQKCNTVEKSGNSKTGDSITLKDNTTKWIKWQKTKPLGV